MDASGPGFALGLILASSLSLVSCDGCRRDHPFIPFLVASASAPTATRPLVTAGAPHGTASPTPAPSTTYPIEGERLPADSRQVKVGVRQIEAPRSAVFEAILRSDWNGDGVLDAIALLRSTAPDMLAYLAACLHPETIENRSLPAAATLPEAVRQSLKLRGELTAGMVVTSGWLFEKATGNYWHNGATAAYSSYAFFNPSEDFAAVVLLNTSPGVNGSFVEILGRHVHQRLAGKPALALGN